MTLVPKRFLFAAVLPPLHGKSALVMEHPDIFEDIDDYYQAVRMPQLKSAKSYVADAEVKERDTRTMRRIALMCTGSRLLLVHAESQLVGIQRALNDIHAASVIGHSILTVDGRQRIWNTSESSTIDESGTGVTTADDINEDTCVSVINTGTYMLTLKELGKRISQLSTGLGTIHRARAAIDLVDVHIQHDVRSDIDSGNVASVVAKQAVAVIRAVSGNGLEQPDLRFPHTTNLTSRRERDRDDETDETVDFVNGVGLTLAEELEKIIEPCAGQSDDR